VSLPLLLRNQRVTS